MLTLILSASMLAVPSEPVSGSQTAEYVIPGGETVGIKLYTKGLLVIGLSEGDSPARAAGLKRGDIILKANGMELSDTAILSNIVSGGGSIRLECMRGEKTFSADVMPQRVSGMQRLGIWVRDSTAGLGTVTFYRGNSFAALGHAVTDADTGDIMTLSGGTITEADVVGINAGKRGSPGELLGTFSQTELGRIQLNCENGLYGICPSPPQKQPIQIAARNEVSEGDAYILADIDGGGAKKYYITLERLSMYSHTKSIVFKVTDKALLEKTGGIVQGMSGAPIIQNERLIGAVTHVFVNDPCRGYGIFAENMLKSASQI